jgi:hypothetical protein
VSNFRNYEIISGIHLNTIDETVGLTVTGKHKELFLLCDLLDLDIGVSFVVEKTKIKQVDTN